jgi:hypothetical protein
VDPVRGSPQISAATVTSVSSISGCCLLIALSRSRSASSAASRRLVRADPASLSRASVLSASTRTFNGSVNHSSP